MMSFKTLSLSALLGLMMAALPVNSAQIEVTVGGPGGITLFNPNNVVAQVGDTVVFTFQQKNHTVSQSSFAQPCSPLPGGFDSGFNAVADNATTFPTAQFQVLDLNPVWVYCRQTGHCQKGMVFAINPGDQFAAFLAAATGNATTSTSAPAATATSPTVSSLAPAASTTTTGTTQDHRVIVGGSTLTFEPANITAQPGDTVTFEFHQKNHTSTQSSFNAPCQALASTSTSGQVGFDSGFNPVPSNATSFPTFTIQVNDTAPIWAYCRQQGHCGEGMVFAVNANESSAKSFEAFQALAQQLNGTGTNSTANTGKNGAGAVRLGGAGLVAGVTAVLFTLTL
ncbi:hypothetical protein BC827DRAFT_1236135 [Russula dissimulans]|nr:hypothetical protein BC827DRAFT_1236135 [Russula dissimulans]